jgi:hypothetical protein
MNGAALLHSGTNKQAREKGHEGSLKHQEWLTVLVPTWRDLCYNTMWWQHTMKIVFERQLYMLISHF